MPGVVSEQFGPIFIPSLLEEAVKDHLELWLPTYIREIEKQNGLQPNVVKDPVKYTNRNSFDALKGEALPRVVVISPGTSDTQKTGSTYTGTWRIGVGVAMAAQSEENANFLAKVYAAAVRTLILQKQGLNGNFKISGVEWVEESYDDLPIDHQTLFYKAAGVYFTFNIGLVNIRATGPDTPDQPNYPSYGEVQQVIIETEKL